MFNIFKSKEERIEELMDAIKDAGRVQPVEVPREDKAAYSIGRTEQGKTTFTIGADGYRSTLTMTDAGCRQLIRMLEAAMYNEEHTGETE